MPDVQHTTHVRIRTDRGVVLVRRLRSGVLSIVRLRRG